MVHQDNLGNRKCHRQSCRTKTTAQEQPQWRAESFASDESPALACASNALGGDARRPVDKFPPEFDAAQRASQMWPSAIDIIVEREWHR
jgi:hypothetical protein